MLVLENFESRLDSLSQIFHVIKISLVPAFVLVSGVTSRPVVFKVFKMEVLAKLAELALDPGRQEQATKFFNEFSRTLQAQGKKHPSISGALLLGSLSVGGLHTNGSSLVLKIQQDINSAGSHPNLMNSSTSLAESPLQRVINEFFL